MFNNKLVFVLAVILSLSLASTSLTICINCLGDSLVEDITKFETQSKCWYNRFKDVIPRLKITAMESVVELIVKSLESSNAIVAEDCKSKLKLKPCPDSDNDKYFECLMSYLKIFGESFRDQEKCHGQGILNDKIAFVRTVIKALQLGLTIVHPECEFA